MNDKLFSELIRTIVTMSLSGSVLALMLFIIKPFIKNRLSKSLHYYSWVIIVLIMILPLCKMIKLPVNSEFLPVSTIHEMVGGYMEAADDEQHSKAVTVQKTPDGSSELQPEKVPWTGLLLIWGTGAVIYLTVNLYGYCRFVRKLKISQASANTEESTILLELSKNFRTPLLYRSRLVSTPMLRGFFHPVIILPDTGYTKEQMENILSHELIHLRRKDVLVKWLMVLANAIHWMNPIMYFICRRTSRACELACDEAVIKYFDASRKRSYGDTLIAVAAASKMPKAVLSATMCEEKSAMRERLNSIMRHRKHKKSVIIFSAVVLLSFACAAVVLGSSNINETPAAILFREYGNEVAALRPVSLIKQVDLEDGRALIFYYNANDNLSCTLFEKGFLNYKLIRSSLVGEIGLKNTSPAPFIFYTYNSEKSWLIWGVLQDSSIAKVLIGGQEAKLVEADNLRLYYFLGAGGEKPVHQYLDQEGNPIK